MKFEFFDQFKIPSNHSKKKPINNKVKNSVIEKYPSKPDCLIFLAQGNKNKISKSNIKNKIPTI